MSQANVAAREKPPIDLQREVAQVAPSAKPQAQAAPAARDQSLGAVVESQNAGSTPATAEVVQVSQTWSCAEPVRLDVEGKAVNESTEPLTVGVELLMSCEGAPVSLSRETLKFKLPDEEKYMLRLLAVRGLSDTKADLIVTTWTPGDVKVEKPLLTDGTTTIALSPFTAQVVSVIKPETNPEGKPAPPWGPIGLMWPLSIWGVVGALLLAVLLAGLLSLRKTFARRRLVALLANNASAMTPYSQFNKELRRIAKEVPQTISRGAVVWAPESAAKYFEELNRIFRWYLTREFVIPAIDESPSTVVKELKRASLIVHKAVGPDLKLALAELEKATKVKSALSVDDAHQLSELCRTLAERITKARSV